ncbi:MAG: helix-turn-helix domain-containing protein [Opitutaceae bacterium]|nr:helix-turn-helix domain-containing protein [Opitutaceae bacterium]
MSIPDNPPPRPRLAAAEQAISAFERIHKVRVSIHDLEGNLAPFILPDRFHHRSPLCLAVKACGHEPACIAFEVHQLRPRLASMPEGRVHVCHAGLVEWVVPVFNAGKLAWVLFAGPRLPGGDLSPDHPRARPTRWRKPPWRAAQSPEPAGEAAAQDILEHLRQLAARLRLWVADFQHVRPSKSPDAFASSSLTRRQTAVLRFIEENYTEDVTLADLARTLNLSESRGSHVVRQCCGATFRDLLIQRRLRAAMELLNDSGMSVLQVALVTGFSDVAHFHRLFHRRTGMTPAKYRAYARQLAPGGAAGRDGQ